MSGPGRLKAPAADGAILAVPPLADAGSLIAANQQLFASSPIDILGRPLADLRALARREVVALASQYLQQAGEPVPPAQAGGLLLAGHQPELVHPGVWAKHFALHGLAQRHGLTPLNLVVDHDTVKSASLRLPARTAGRVILQSVPFDSWTGEEPYEERPVHDEALFASFPERAGATLDGWGIEPILPEFWSQAGTSGLLGDRLARARRAYERRWGCRNLEVPTSWLCRGQAFAWFAVHLLRNIDRFIDVHNAALHEYRRANRIRSKNHPVPELSRDGDWREVPFWGWRAGQRRGRLLVRPSAGRFELRVGPESWPTLADRPEAWPELAGQGCKVRCRALTTTIFARLYLGDLFMHGIGGGKYDELTDVIIRRFHGIEPPRFLILSATLHLPLPARRVSRTERAAAIRAVRDLHFNPQRYLAGDAEVQSLIAAKQGWIDQQGQAVNARLRFQAIRALSDRLRPRLADRASAARQHLADVEAMLHDNAILLRRDYASCLFPEHKLRNLLTGLLGREG